MPVSVLATWVAQMSEIPVKRNSRAILPMLLRIVAFVRLRRAISATSGLSLETPFGIGSAAIRLVISSTTSKSGRIFSEAGNWVHFCTSCCLMRCLRRTPS